MENLIQMLIPLIIVILTFVLGNSRRRRERGNVQKEREENTMPEGESTPPPFMEDFPFETRLEDMILQENEVEDTPVVEEPEPVTVQEPVEPSPSEPPPVPVESPAGIRSMPGTALLEISPKTFRQGIILQEILGRPKARRPGAPFQYRRDL